jgi:hypothetical protein
VDVNNNYYDNVEHKVEISESRKIPIIESRLKKRIVTVPEVIRGATGIKIFGKRIKSIIGRGITGIK